MGDYELMLTVVELAARLGVTTRTLRYAFRYALEALILWLEESYGFSRIDAYLLLGQILEARCTAFVNPTFTYIAKVPKRYLPKL